MLIHQEMVTEAIEAAVTKCRELADEVAATPEQRMLAQLELFAALAGAMLTLRDSCGEGDHLQAITEATRSCVLVIPPNAGVGAVTDAEAGGPPS